MEFNNTRFDAQATGVPPPQHPPHHLPPPLHEVSEDTLNYGQATTTITIRFQVHEENSWGWRAAAQTCASWFGIQNRVFGLESNLTSNQMGFESESDTAEVLPPPLPSAPRRRRVRKSRSQPNRVRFASEELPATQLYSVYDIFEDDDVNEIDDANIPPTIDQSTIQTERQDPPVRFIKVPIVPSPQTESPNGILQPIPPSGAEPCRPNTKPTFRYVVAPVSSSVSTEPPLVSCFKSVKPPKKRGSWKTLDLPPAPPAPSYDELPFLQPTGPPRPFTPRRVPDDPNVVRIHAVEASTPYIFTPWPQIRTEAQKQRIELAGLMWDMGSVKYWEMIEDQKVAEECRRQIRAEREAKEKEQEKERERWQRKVERIIRLRANQPVVRPHDPVIEAQVGGTSTPLPISSVHQTDIRTRSNAPPQHHSTSSLVFGQEPIPPTSTRGSATATAPPMQTVTGYSHSWTQPPAGPSRVQRHQDGPRGSKRAREGDEKPSTSNLRDDERRPTRRMRLSKVAQR
ncbi:hypothetical protein BDN72DRAFT_965071 [Pluteus cervinus]|uniref:Uncharacterized protein n=1 Tax=Pluteus cervinus TaxID=181527 RepID=A0ACD3A7A3_9AGAR|nr:hypothetical protein BDN72DRAFT_965071 [Pluteus cervinus]